MKRAFLAQEWRNARFGSLGEKQGKRLGHQALREKEEAAGEEEGDDCALRKEPYLLPEGKRVFRFCLFFTI